MTSYIVHVEDPTGDTFYPFDREYEAYEFCEMLEKYHKSVLEAWSRYWPGLHEFPVTDAYGFRQKLKESIPEYLRFIDFGTDGLYFRVRTLEDAPPSNWRTIPFPDFSSITTDEDE